MRGAAASLSCDCRHLTKPLLKSFLINYIHTHGVGLPARALTPRALTLARARALARARSLSRSGKGDGARRARRGESIEAKA